MKSLIAGVVLIIIVGIGGLLYRNAVEYPKRHVACQMDAKICPDGTSVGRTGNSCTFPSCPPPNVSLADVGIVFAIPNGFVDAEFLDSSTVASYEKPADPPASGASTSPDSIVISRYSIDPDSTALATIQKTAIGGASGLPVPITSFSSTILGTHRFTVVSMERFEGVVNTAYYLARTADVLRFDAIDREVMNWTESDLDVSTLTAHKALKGLLTTLQGDNI